MEDFIFTLGRLAMGFAYIAAPLLAIILVLKYRDRREAALNTVVLKELNAPELRGLYTVRLKAGVLAGQSVIIDLWGCSREQMWEVVSRLSDRLPSHVNLVLNGVSDPVSHTALTLRIERRVPVCVAACTP